MTTASVTQTGGATTVAITVSRGLQGVQGDQGEQGIQGIQGIQGEVGPPGPTDYTLLTNVPATFPPSAHTHPVSDIVSIAGERLLGRHAGGSGAGQEVTVGNGIEFQGSGIRRSALTGDVTASAGSNATTIANDAVTNAKLANMATETIKGRTTAGTGDPEDLTAAQARTVMGVSPALVVSDTAPTTPVNGQQWLGLTSEILFVWSTTKNKWIVADANFDSDAAFYINNVEVADTQSLEIGVRNAINSFVFGCKQDGIWDSIKASCILAGARTLTGALVPLVGTAPTNNNFVSGDYDRETGLVGNGSTKYLNSNRNNNADPQDDKHMSVYLGAALSANSLTNRVHIGVANLAGATGSSVIATDPISVTTDSARRRINGATAAVIGSSAGLAAGFHGANRSVSTDIVSRVSGSNTTTASTSETPQNLNLHIFARNLGANGIDSYSTARLSFYSIGESLNLALLDTRVGTLMTDLAAAIP